MTVPRSVIWTTLLVAACDSDLYSDTSTCRDGNTATLCQEERADDAKPPLQPSSPVAQPSKEQFVHQYLCTPNDPLAQSVGTVSFKFNAQATDRMQFSEPQDWHVAVQAATADPPQDPPSLTLRWTSQSGKKLFANLVWRSDATPDPSALAVREIGTKGGKWAVWACKRIKG